MALGTVITLGLNFTGPNVQDLPTVSYTDPIEAAGSLLLLDATHPVKAFPVGVPAHGATLKNLLATKAAPLLGGSSGDVSVQSIYSDPTHGKVERSTKGGIHVIQSTKQAGLREGFQLRLPTAIVDYFKANPSHQFYISQWGKTTRAETASQHSVAGMSGTAAKSFAFTLGDGVSAPVGAGPTVLGYRQVAEVAGQNTFRNAGVADLHTDFTGANINPASAAIFEVGNFLVPNQGTGKAGQHGAQIFYRGYIEDLTVSGRTYAEVDAIDHAEYTRHVLSEGGRYYGDTAPTDPSTLA